MLVSPDDIEEIKTVLKNLRDNHVNSLSDEEYNIITNIISAMDLIIEQLGKYLAMVNILSSFSNIISLALSEKNKL